MLWDRVSGFLTLKKADFVGMGARRDYESSRVVRLNFYENLELEFYNECNYCRFCSLLTKTGPEFKNSINI